MYKVQIVSFENDEVVREVICKTEHEANRVEAGMSINLNHEKYYAQIIEDQLCSLTHYQNY